MSMLQPAGFPTSTPRVPARSLSLFLLLLAALPLVFQALPPAPPLELARPVVPSALTFFPNAGQAAPAARFQTRALGGTLSFSSSAVSLELPGAAPAMVVFEGADAALLAGEDEHAARFNMLRGADPAAWRTDLPTYAALRYQGLYPGIDLRYDGVGGGLKGTYTVAPSANPAQIRWAYQGATDVRIDQASGDLLIDLPAAVAGAPLTLREQAPIAWQELGGRREPVAVRYQLTQGPTGPLAGFALGSYDHSQPLVIDPYLVYATLLGGSAGDEGRDVAVDAAGNLYVTGTTTSADLPQAGSPQPTYAGPATGNFGDAFVAKLNAAGDALVYLTYLGGSGADIGDAIAVDGAGNVYLTGMTQSANFPVQSAFQAAPGGNDCGSPPCSDAFVAKLNAAGNALVFSSYLGGARSENLGLLDAGTRGLATGIAVDGAGEIYITGTTDSANFPTEGEAYGDGDGAFADIFVTRLSADGQTLRYSSYLGGSGADYSGDIAVAPGGVAYITGGTLSTSFPTRGALQDEPGGPGSDAIIAAFDTTLTGSDSLRFSTYFGGDDTDLGMGIAVDERGLYIAGHTASANGFPLEDALQASNASAGAAIPREAFAAMLSLDGSELLYSTYLGGSGNDVGYDLAINGQGHMVLLGQTLSDNFPLKGAWQAARRDSQDLFVTILDPGAEGEDSLIGSTYLGSAGTDYGYGVAVDAAGSIYLTGITGGATGETLPVRTTIGPNATGNGILLAKLGPNPTSRLALPLLSR
jgi:hypothetical protein